MSGPGLSTLFPDMYNYDLASLTQQSEDSLATVASVTEAVTSVVRRLGWDRAGVTLVMFNTGVTQRVTDSLVTEAEVCVRRVIHLNLNYLTSPAWRYLVSLHMEEEDLNRRNFDQQKALKGSKVIQKIPCIEFLGFSDINYIHMFCFRLRMF